MIASIFRYTKLLAWFGIYRYYPSDIVEDIIVKNINDCGCVIIKFFQWISPIIEMSCDSDKIFPPKKLDTIYENCNYHSVNYTKYIYEKEYNEPFDSKYEIKQLIASASMGQVYKVLEKKTGEIQAFKVLHPRLLSQINLFKLIATVLFDLPVISKWIHYYIPVHINSFIINFESQINLVNEANNCLFFKKKYSGNKYIVIPEVYKCSQNTLFMSYEEGTSFEQLDVSEYTKTKCILLLQLFTKHNKLFLHHMHGDIHKGNWKIRINNNMPQLIIYDYGYCWDVPKNISDKIQTLERAFNEIKCDETKRHEYTENIVNAYHILLGDSCSKESIQKIFMDFDMNPDIKTVFPQILQLSRETGFLIEPILFQILIVVSQLHKYIESYHYAIPDGGVFYDYYFSKIVPDIVSFCKTYNIFSEYVEYLQKEYKHYKQINKETKISNFSQFKSIAVS